MDFAFKPDDIIEIVQPKEIRGSTSQAIRGIAPLASAKAGDLAFLSSVKYRGDLDRTEASVVLVPLRSRAEPRTDQLILSVERPSWALAQVCARLEKLLWPMEPPGVHPSAVAAASARIAGSASVGPFCVVEEGAEIGEGTRLQPFVFVGRKARIGRDCWLMARSVVAAECELGDRVQLQPGAVIGSDGFGYETVQGRHHKVPQIGRVVLENDVEVGANTTIDRARFNQTVIGEGTKIDNLVQIGHNVILGKHCFVAGGAAVAGSTRVGNYVYIGGQAGIAGHLTVGDGSLIGGGAGVTRDLSPKSYVWGTPAIPHLLEQKFVALKARLPELFRRVERLEELLPSTPDDSPAATEE